MDSRRLKNMTERQFKRVLEREGRVVTKPLTQETVTVLFKDIQGSSGEHVSVYYLNDTDLHKGEIVDYNGKKYLLSNESSAHSDVFKVSILKECTVVLNIYGKKIPMALTSSLYMNNLGVSLINNLNLATTDTDYIRDLERGSKFICFGSIYKYETVFYNDGVAYIFLIRQGNAVYGLKELQYYGLTTYDLSDEKVELMFTVVTTYDDIVWSEAPITYTVSSSDIAEVDEDGWLIMKKKGVVTVTANCSGVILKKTITIK